MTKPARKISVRLTDSFRRDLAGVMAWSAERFGDTAALRYDALIQQTLRDIASDPQRPGSRKRPELLVEGARTYHLALSRDRVDGRRVKEPRHFVLYRWREERVVEVARILHDSCDLTRHLPEGYRHIDVKN